MTNGIDPVALRTLMSTPPPAFVAARTVLATELRNDGHRDAATAIAAIRRPSWIEWALNEAAVIDPDLVAEYASAASESRDAQQAAVERREGTDLRGALRQLRDTVTSFAALASESLRGVERSSETAELVAKLGEIAGDETLVNRLRRGLLGAGTLGADGSVAELVQPPASASKGSRSASKKPSSRKKAAEPVDLDAARREREQRRRIERIEKELATTSAELEEAQSAEAEAEWAVNDAEAQLADAKQVLVAARRRRIAATKASTKAGKAAERTSTT